MRFYLESEFFMKNTRKIIIWLLIVIQLSAAKSSETRDYVLSNKSESEIIKDVILADTTSKEKVIVRQTKSWTNKTKTKEFNINTTKRNKQEIFEEKIIIDNFGNEQKVFVRSELSVREETKNTNQNIKISYEHTPEFRNKPITKMGLTAENKQNVKIGVFVPLVVVSAIMVPALIWKKNNPDKVRSY
jgi:hypothetical protein